MRRKLVLTFALLVGVGIGIWLIQLVANPLNRTFLTWMRGDSAARAELVVTQRDTCPDAPFALPTDGFIGLLFGDPRGPYSLARRHQGIDIFVDQAPGTVPIYAAYDGYVSRERDWVSTIVLRIPDDPLQPGRQIWLYHTHMADAAGNDFIEPAFDRGASEVFVKQGTLLGYVGNYDGNQPPRIWQHLHLSVVLDDGNGTYLNEYFIENTLDPTPYFGIDVAYGSAERGTPTCTTAPNS